MPSISLVQHRDNFPIEKILFCIPLQLLFFAFSLGNFCIPTVHGPQLKNSYFIKPSSFGDLCVVDMPLVRPFNEHCLGCCGLFFFFSFFGSFPTSSPVRCDLIPFA